MFLIGGLSGEWIGFAAATLTTLSFVPQAAKTIRSRDTSGISLGLMMNNAVLWSALPLGMWWWFVPPGLGITLIVGSLYIMNVGLDEVFNPKLREL